MRLNKFRVKNFRSVKDSGWIECDDVTTLVGINEAGKSNLLLGLWKLNPARGGNINALEDMPASKYAEWRDRPNGFTFVEAEFDLDENEVAEVMSLSGCDEVEASVVSVSRCYDGTRSIGFPSFKSSKTIGKSQVETLCNEVLSEIEDLQEMTKSEEGIKECSVDGYQSILDTISGLEGITIESAETIRRLLPTQKVGVAATSEISPVVQKANAAVADYLAKTSPVNPAHNEDVQDYIVETMPHFVYYSNYGNLDSKIYLPHAIKWLNGEEVEGIETSEDKVRTLRVLFEYVNLDPNEILSLGQSPDTKRLDGYNRVVEVNVSEDQVNTFGRNVEERFQLLNSAASSLTKEFKEWWRQGSYKFRFTADSDYFRILVSDDKREDEIDLEKRSTGLQWFLSFFLVFLVESQRAHEGSILLLDEAGMSLHPLAQKDLISFFENLSNKGQIIHTTHSPFLIDTGNIDRVRAVYVDNDGNTVATNKLREGAGKNAEQSIYAAYAALGLTVSDTLLLGCQPVIVEGTSDQIYLNSLKTFLVRESLFSPRDELVFIPSGGVRGVSSIASIVGGANKALPYVVLDSDEMGKDFKSKLESQLYRDAKQQVICVGDLVDIEAAEIEDLIPLDLMEKKLNTYFRDIDEFDVFDEIDTQKSRVGEIERLADKYGITLPDGWKVDLAKSVKTQILKGRVAIDEGSTQIWLKLFDRFNETN